MSFITQFLLISLFSLGAGGYFLWIGLRGWLGRRAFLIPARQLMWFVVACYVPQALMVVRTLLDFTRGQAPTMILVLQGINFIILIVLGFVFWRQFSGYLAFGVTEEMFRNALIAALRHKQLAYEETLSRIHLPELNTSLQIALMGWVGTAQLRSKQPKDRLLLVGLAQAMNQELAQSTLSPAQFSFIVHSIMGIGLIIMSIAFFVYTIQALL